MMQLNVVTDINGVFGTMDRQLRIDSILLTSLGGNGERDSITGDINFAVHYDMEYFFRDISSDEIVGTTSDNILFTETGTYDPVRGLSSNGTKTYAKHLCILVQLYSMGAEHRLL